MKIISVKRNTTYQKIHTIQMGELTTKVTSIKRYLFGWPIKTLHKYRETYYGEVKDTKGCMLFI
ncbi:hypothetical protein PW52_14975 [Tamlana sedimentorum]|uniref:Uncharacterized protein n=1 Tax=Neotamlana sedimentorum TaxID=1435349 RepID=A0A0D7W0Y2_9FLAO|nr:hypothetical protein [Tamlana sedimentorum]KJD32780.1 hypothetical protein PW52_14975 [Tamlana sedimentorum]